MPQKLQKPKQHTKTYWDYHEVEHYLEQLHGKDFRDYYGKYKSGKSGYNKSIEYCDWWHWICDLNEVRNGSFITLPDISYLEDPEVPSWKKEIMQYFIDFLGDDYEERLWVEW